MNQPTVMMMQLRQSGEGIKHLIYYVTAINNYSNTTTTYVFEYCSTCCRKVEVVVAFPQYCGDMMVFIIKYI